jgi:hypothetical protein
VSAAEKSGWKALHVEEAIALVVAIVPAEDVHERPHEVAPQACALGDGLERPAQVLADVVDALLVVHRPLLQPVLGGHAVLGDVELLVVGPLATDAHHQIVEPLGIDHPVPVGARDLGACHVLADALERMALRALLAGGVVVAVVGTVVCLEEVALVVVDAQAVVVRRRGSELLEVLGQKLQPPARKGGEPVGTVQRLLGVPSVKRGLQQEPVVEHVVDAGRLDIARCCGVVRVLGREGMDDADGPGMAQLLEGEHGTGVGDHHVVHGLEGQVEPIALATRPGALDVHVGHDGPDLVEREPVRHLGILREAEARVALEGIDGMLVEEVPLTVERIRRVKVVERHVRLHAPGATFREEPMVERHALGVGHGIVPVGEDARPCDGDADAVDAILLAEPQVLRIAVVEVTRRVGGEQALLVQVVVPGNLALAVRARLALALVGRRRRAKHEVLGKACVLLRHVTRLP